MPSIDWSVLKRKLNGHLIFPGDRIYDLARSVMNGRVNRRPVVIARVENENDVVECVKFCVANDIAITGRCGGHGAEGFCVENNAMMIDLSGMQSVQVDLEENVVRVSGGAFWGQVDLATYPRGLAAGGGGCQEVGVGGLTHGGGFGPISRKFGLTCDNLLSARIVTSRDQKVIVTNATTEPDLFWAMRGGGGGNFGIVTEFTYRLNQVGRAFTFGTLIYNWGPDTKKVFQFYRDWMRTGSGDPRYERLTILPIFALSAAGDPTGILSVFYLDGDADVGKGEALTYITEIMTAANLPIPVNAGPAKDLPSALAQVLGPGTLPAYTGTESTTAWPGSGLYWKNGFMKNDFPDAAIDTLMQFLEKAPRTPSRFRHDKTTYRAPDLTFGFFESLGGAIAKVKPTDTAFFWRDRLFSFSFIGIYPTDDPVMAKQVQQWATEFLAAMQPYLSEGVYVNYMQADLPNWQQAYYGDNYPRLRAIKQIYDPPHIFRFAQDLGQPAPAGGAAKKNTAAASKTGTGKKRAPAKKAGGKKGRQKR